MNCKEKQSVSLLVLAGLRDSEPSVVICNLETSGDAAAADSIAVKKLLKF